MNTLERNLSPGKKKTLSVKSNIESLAGEAPEIKIELGQDGQAKAAAFFDIDNTLSDLKDVHYRAIAELYPEADPAELSEVFEAGWKLGNSYREQYRMHGIYASGHADWKDPEVFYQQAYLPKAAAIDSAGFPEHELAASLLEKYSAAGVKVLAEIYQTDPQIFERAKIKPIFHLVKLYKRLGIPMTAMTANPTGLAQAYAKYLGLAEDFLDIAADENMVGGGKEKAVAYLVDRLAALGVAAPKDRLILVGDSLRGDIGIGAKLPADWSAKIQGLLVLKDEAAWQKITAQIKDNPELAKIIADLDVSALVIDQVPLDARNQPQMGGQNRKNFLHHIHGLPDHS